MINNSYAPGCGGQVVAVCPSSAPYVIGGGISNGGALSTSAWDVTSSEAFSGAEQSGQAYGWEASLPAVKGHQERLCREFCGYVG